MTQSNLKVGQYQSVSIYSDDALSVARNGCRRNVAMGGAAGDVVSLQNSNQPPFLERLDRIEAMLTTLIQQQTIKDMYTTEEVAQILGRQPFTVREWCRLGRVRAQKRACGRGLSKEWVISHAELQRIKNEGLLTSEH